MSRHPGRVPDRLHPFTPLVLTLCVAVAAVSAPGPASAVSLYVVTALAVTAAGVGRAALRALVPLAPLWLFLFLLHGVMGDSDGERLVVTGVALSREGLALAATQAARLGAIATASLGLYASFSPSRFVDAVAERGWPFVWAYLVVATLLALPRFRARAVAILDAQRSRGLRLRGSPVNRIRAIGPVTFPLLLGALAEVDERGFALETRCAGAVARRTPLDPPIDSRADHVVRWAAAVGTLGLVCWRVVG